MATKLEVVSCHNCSSVSSNPGANIASPIAMSIIGILGNAIALATIHRMKLERHRTVFFVFVAGLAFADLLGQVLTTFPVLLTYTHGYYIGGSWMCMYHAFTMILFGILTPMIACAMAIERYFGIRHGYFYLLHFNPYRARLALVTLWVTAILFSSLPLMGFGQYAIQYPGTWCFLNLHPENRIDAAYSVTFAVLNLFLIIVMIICNIVVQCTLVAMRCQRSSAGRADRFRRTHRNPQQEELEVQMMFVLLAITIVFTLCWTPLQFQILKNQFYEHKTAADHAEDLLAVRLASINQILDPWVYILCKKICFRRGCAFWNAIVRHKWGGSFQRQSSQLRGFNNGIRTPSLRSALVIFRAQSLRSSSREKTQVQVMEVPSDDGIRHGVVVLQLEVAGDHSTTLMASGSSVPHGSSSSEPTSSAAITINDIPIPIFTSSQYSIQRKRRKTTSSHKRRIRRELMMTKAGAKISSVYSNIGDITRESVGPTSLVRRHSWCCSGITTNGAQLNMNRTKTYQTKTSLVE